jgi:hypothetical protein
VQDSPPPSHIKYHSLAQVRGVAFLRKLVVIIANMVIGYVDESRVARASA